MLTENSNDVFYITLSKWKVWLYTFFCWSIACVPLIITLIFIKDLFSNELGSTSDSMIFIAIFGTVFLLLAAIPFMFLTKLKKPMATLTRNGFSGLRNLKLQSFAWGPNTVIYEGKNTTLANLDPTQSRASKLWHGPKTAVIIHHIFAKQKHQDVMDAINRLSPYPVKQPSFWGAPKR